MRTGDSFLVGAVVQYSCSVGFNLVGSGSATCQRDGTWSAPLPTCAKSSTPEGKGPTLWIATVPVFIGQRLHVLALGE